MPGPDKTSNIDEPHVPDEKLFKSALAAIKARGGKPTMALARQALQNVEHARRAGVIPYLLRAWNLAKYAEPVFDDFVIPNGRQPCEFHGLAIYDPDTGFAQPVHPSGHQYILLKKFRDESPVEQVRWSEIDPETLERPNALAVLTPDEVPKSQRHILNQQLIEGTFTALENAAKDNIRLLMMSRNREHRKLRSPHRSSPQLDQAVKAVEAAQQCYRMTCEFQARLMAKLHVHALSNEGEDVRYEEIEGKCTRMEMEITSVRELVPQEIWDIENAWTTKFVRWWQSVGEWLRQRYDERGS